MRYRRVAVVLFGLEIHGRPAVAGAHGMGQRVDVAPCLPVEGQLGRRGIGIDDEQGLVAPHALDLCVHVAFNLGLVLTERQVGIEPDRTRVPLVPRWASLDAE